MPLHVSSTMCSFIVTLGCDSSVGYPWPREVSFKIFTVKYFKIPAALYPLLTNSDRMLFLDCHIPLFKGEITIKFEKQQLCCGPASIYSEINTTSLVLKVLDRIHAILNKQVLPKGRCVLQLNPI